VLVVDDEPLIHVIVSRCLERAGFEVLHAMDGLQAVKLLSVAAEQPCLAITDMRMPHMGGAALGAWVRSGYPSTPILYISGYMDELPPPANEGSCQALAKPFTPEVLLEKVRELHPQTAQALPSR
jgi:CheY-like chemotaxis protein